MKKNFIIKMMMIAIILVTSFNLESIFAKVKINELSEKEKSQLKETKLGIGGGGALFEPAISPFDSNNMLVVPDMGGIYITHNKGEKWDRVNLYGTVMSATYDPNRENVIYAGGSGLYRSTDYGETFDLIYPRKDDIITRLTHNENSLQYYFTYSKQYDRNKYVKNILIDPDDSNHIFILCYSYKKGVVLESTDNGESFTELFSYQKSKFQADQFDFNELLYRKETKDIFVINGEQIIGYNLIKKEKNFEYTSSLGLVDAATVYENGKTYFIIIENTDKLTNSDTCVYYTNDFKEKKDITDVLTRVQPTTFYRSSYGEVTYKYNFHYIAATSLNNIYVTNWSYQASSSIKKYPYTIDGIIRYHNKEAKYLFGNPFKDHNTLTTRNWADGNTYSLGIAASKQNEDEFLFTTLCGVVYSPDSIHLHPRYSTVTEGKYPNAKYVTSGIDEQATYGVYEDPFHKGVLLLLNTDLGLIRSEDNGASWSRANNGIPNSWVNTIYDAAFDERRENYVYSVWSGRHNVPYSASNETDNRYGGFAISKDGGKTWDTKYSSGLPKNATPAKMAVVYPKDTMEVTIYLATFNEGFFVSYDSGKTFKPMNDGISRVSYKDEKGYQYILASDIEVKEGRIFGITAKNAYSNAETRAGELFEYVKGKWKKIPLPKNVQTPRDIYYHDGVLYITGTATAVWDYKTKGVDFTNYGGGVYTYKNGEFNQIFDESLSTGSVQIDSKGTMYISDINGNIYRKEKNKDYQKIYDSYHYVSKGLQISKDDDHLYLATSGGGLLKLENLNSLYTHVCTGGAPTCTKKAVCEICGKEYGKLDPTNHESSHTHVINKREPTYEEEGYTGDIVYDCCNAIKEKGKVIPKLTHDDSKDDKNDDESDEKEPPKKDDESSENESPKKEEADNKVDEENKEESPKKEETNNKVENNKTENNKVETPNKYVSNNKQTSNTQVTTKIDKEENKNDNTVSKENISNSKQEEMTSNKDEQLRDDGLADAEKEFPLSKVIIMSLLLLILLIIIIMVGKRIYNSKNN